MWSGRAHLHTRENALVVSQDIIVSSVEYFDAVSSSRRRVSPSVKNNICLQFEELYARRSAPPKELTRLTIHSMPMFVSERRPKVLQAPVCPVNALCVLCAAFHVMAPPPTDARMYKETKIHQKVVYCHANTANTVRDTKLT